MPSHLEFIETAYPEVANVPVSSSIDIRGKGLETNPINRYTPQ